MEHILKSTGFEVLIPDIMKAEDCYLYDSQNRRYIDFESGVWAAALGHNHPRVNEVIKVQLDQTTHLGYRYSTPVMEEAAVKVLETVGFDDGRCVFLSSGSEAVEFGVQASRSLSGKPLLLGLAGSFLASYGSAGRRSSDEWYFFNWSICAACQHSSECDIQCSHLKEIPLDLIGGFVLEPGNTSGQVKLPPKGLIRNLAKLIRQHNGITMINEITAGVGRTGAWYGFQHYDIEPDIVSIGKGIGNGYPVSVIALNISIAEKLESMGFHYAQSHLNNPLGCAVVKEVVSVIQENNLIEKARIKGDYFLSKLIELKERHACIKDVRGRGLMIAVEFDVDNSAFSLESTFREMLERGFILGYSQKLSLLRFYPPLTIKESDIDAMLESLDKILSKCSKYID